jgi:hypothetical protein
MQHPLVPVTRARAGHSALLAVLLTIGLAVFAAYAGPYGGGDTQPASPTKPAVGGARAVPVVPTIPPPPVTASPGPTAAPLPRFARYGSPVPTGTVVVAGDRTAFVNLDTGRLEPVPGTGWPSQVVRTRSGLACVCVTMAVDAAGQVARVTISPIGSGSPAKSIFVGSYRGFADPARSQSEQDPAVLVSASSAAAGEKIYVSTAVRGRAAWELAIAVVSLDTGRVLQRLLVERVPLTRRVEHPAVAPSPASPVDAPTLATAGPPDVRLSPDGRHAMLAAWVETYSGPGRPHWLATLEGGLLRDVRPFSDKAGWMDTNGCVDEAFASPTTYYALCATWTSSPKLSWMKLDGTGHEISIEGIGSPNSFSVSGALDLARGKYYIWSPATLGVARIDLLGGRLEQMGRIQPPTTGSGDDGSLTGLAHALSGWIAPAAVGKTFLEPAVALSPDGSRLYGLGVTTPQNQTSGSTGIWVVDSATLSLVDHWRPNADLASVAATPDGRLVLVSGLAGVDADGRETDSRASLTAYDARTGEIRVVVGDLGSGWLYFPRELNR